MSCERATYLKLQNFEMDKVMSMQRSSFNNSSGRYSLWSYEVLLAFLFACALYAVWSLQFTAGAAGALGSAGSDSFIIVERIDHASSWPWYFQSYLSQIGAQGIVLAGLYQFLDGANVAYYSLIAANVFAFLSAASVAVAVPFLYRNSGLFGVLLVFALFASSRWMFAFSHSLYWALFTLIMPLTYAIAFGHLLEGGRRARSMFLIGLGVIIFVKSVCGYEYITTLTLLACAGYLVSTVESEGTLRVKPLVAIFAACLAGFGVAFIVHLCQLYVIHGGDGIHHIFDRILSHSGGDGVAGSSQILVDRLQRQGGYPLEIDQLVNDLQGHQLMFFWLSFIQYFSIDALTLEAVRVNFSVFSVLGVLAAVRAGYVLYRHRQATQGYPADFAWALGAATALLAALSWQRWPGST